MNFSYTLYKNVFILTLNSGIIFELFTLNNYLTTLLLIKITRLCMSVHTLQIKQITTNMVATTIKYVTFHKYLFIYNNLCDRTGESL